MKYVFWEIVSFVKAIEKQCWKIDNMKKKKKLYVFFNESA